MAKIKINFLTITILAILLILTACADSADTAPSTDAIIPTTETITAPTETIPTSVMLFNKEISLDAESLDLSWLTPSQIEDATDVLPRLTHLKEVTLADSEGSSTLSPTDVRKLMDAAPEVSFKYNFELFDQQFSTADERMQFELVRIGNDGIEQIRSALDIMPNCTYLKVDRCGVDSEVMASVREDYPNVKVAWRIFFGKFSCMTDDEMLRLTNGLKDEHIDQLKYCNDVKYLDIGHDEDLTDISFVKYMPKLEIAIISGSSVEDLSPFQDHQSIEFLELCFCVNLKDISPLANCPNLKFLNISFTGVKDISATDTLPMERFVAMGQKIDAVTQAKFKELHPDCMYRFEGKQCYGYAWRYDDYGYTFSEYYTNMREIFDYDDVGYYSGKGIYDWGY